MQTVTKKGHQYRITIEEIQAGEQESGQTMAFDLDDREDLFNIVDNLKQGSGLDERSATRVGVAIRLLGPVMMKDRKHALFAEFMPHFKTFMHNLKSTIKNAVG